MYSMFLVDAQDVIHASTARPRATSGRSLGILGPGVGGADGLAHLQAAAGQHHRQGARPVVAAGVLVDPRRPAELAPDQHQGVLQHAPAVHVLHQAGPGHVELGQLLFLEDLEVVGVRVPAAGVDGDEGHARLDQPARQQHALAEVGAAVQVAELGVLPCSMSKAFWAAGLVTISKALRVKASSPSIRPLWSASRRRVSIDSQQLAAVLQPAQADAVGQRQVADREIRLRSGRRRPRTDCRRRPGSAAAVLRGAVGHGHVGRHARPARPAFLGGDRAVAGHLVGRECRWSA